MKEELEFTIEKIIVMAKARNLAASYKFSKPKKLQAFHSIETEVELTKMLTPVKTGKLRIRYA